MRGPKVAAEERRDLTGSAPLRSALSEFSAGRLTGWSWARVSPLPPVQSQPLSESLAVRRVEMS